MPPPVPVHRSDLAIVDVPAPGRIRIRGTSGQPHVDVDSVRVVTARREADHVFLGGCLQPYSLDRQVPGGLLVGPFPPAECEAVSRALQAFLALPRRPEPVDEAALLATPEAFHGRLIVTTGLWRSSLEYSQLAGAWLDPPVATPWPRDSEPRRVEVCGLWWCEADHGYGHFGMSKARLDAYTLEPRS